MSQKCPKCRADRNVSVRFGHFIRKSDKRRIQRLKCQSCSHVYSKATFQECYRQRKREINPRVVELLCSGVSQRRSARILRVNRKTVVRKFLFMALKAKISNFKKYLSLKDVDHVQFDDLETSEHTKCKPLSVTLAVEKKSRRILAFKVTMMPAKGHLAKKALKKYGPRGDFRSIGRYFVFQKLSPKLSPKALIESDENPHYKDDIRDFLPQGIVHKTYLGQRGSIVGQGELKKIRFDPLFSLNHTCAMLRANINRLFRKTWCTTKLAQRLSHHIELYTYYHNEVLLKAS